MSKIYNHLSIEDRAVAQVMRDHDAACRQLPASCVAVPRPSRVGSFATMAPAATPDLRRPGRLRTTGGYRCVKAQLRAQRLVRTSPRGAQDG